MDEQAVCPRPVAHPARHDPAHRVADAEDGKQEGGSVAVDAETDGVIGQVDERCEETCHAPAVSELAITYRDFGNLLF